MKPNIFLYDLPTYQGNLTDMPPGKLQIATINAYSYVLAQSDQMFATALIKSDILLPDGISIVIGKRILTGKRIKKIAGEDFFYFEMKRLNTIGGTSFFLGSSPSVLNKIKLAASKDFPNVKVATYSPPFKPKFSLDDNLEMLRLINNTEPDVLFVGMTAPKQEKWAHEHFANLNVQHIVCIGAVFDFYAGTVRRAPLVFRQLGLEWLYRFMMEPARMWRRYLIGNLKFILSICLEYTHKKRQADIRKSMI